MADLVENKMTITDEDGNEQVVSILFTYHHDERNKDYVFFFEGENEEDVMVMSYDENYNLFPIEDEDEYEEIEEILNAYVDGELECVEDEN